MTRPYPVDPQDELRRQARAKISQAAHAGTKPIGNWNDDDLRWALGDSFDAEIARLDGIAVEVQEARTAKLVAQNHSSDLRELAKKVLREWDEEEKRERSTRAYIEAEKRLEARNG